MIHFRQAIQIGSNVTDIIKLPCVISVTKEYWSDNDIRLRYSLFGDTKDASSRWGDSIYAHEGDWLCEDYDGTWHVMKDNPTEDEN